MDNRTNTSDTFFHVVDQVSDFIGFYVITSVCVIGIITNLCFLKLLSNKKLKHKFYQNLWVKTFCDLIVCIVGVGLLNNDCPFRQVKKAYWVLIYNLLMLLFFRISSCATTYAEIYLLLNRCINLFKPNNTILYFNKWVVILFLYLLFTCISAPFIFGIQILNTDEVNMYTSITVEIKIENFLFFKFYPLLYSFILNVLPCILLIALNLINVVGYRKTMKKLSDFRGNGNSRLEILERRFTRIVMILSFMFLFCKVLDIVNIVILYRYKSNELGFQKNSPINFFRNIVFLFNYSFHVINNLFYIYMDSNLRKKLIKISIKKSNIMCIFK